MMISDNQIKSNLVQNMTAQVLLALGS